MKKLLVVVDMQNDFIDGALGTKEAVEIVEGACKKIENYDGDIIFTRDTHFENYLETQEGRNLPVKHCIKDSFGWQIRKEIYEAAKGRQKAIIDKPSFGSTVLAETVKSEGYEEITLIGLCTDICVISNALIIKAYMPEAVVSVEQKLCAGVTPESHKNALEAMKMCQIAII